MLQKILGIVTKPPIPFVLGVLLAIALVWFGGHLLQSGYGWPSTTVIVLLCALIVVLTVGFVVLRSLRARQKARAIENEIRNQAKAQAAALPPGNQGDIDSLQARFDEALESLKSSKLGRGALYAMPWFVIIGPPGSGKTTAITESGLNFPFMKGPNQKRGIRGLGGTRNCDWWFTDQSILLDTAGRYTTEAEDHDEWLQFLGMIKKARKLKPINGVLVALSITDVLNATEEGLERHATTIRQRIDELVKQLEVVFPIYLLFTKCDLLDGFVEFFSSMSKEERAQVWGTTFDAKATGADDMHQRFAAEFELLCQRIDEERLRLLVPDRPGAQQRQVFSLSLQLRAAKRKLTEFVRLLTQPNPYSDASELRGVYLTSGTQEGAPIDLVLQKLSSAFGLQARADADPLAAVDAKSYFIRDLFTKVIYADRELAHSSAGVQRRRELGRKALIYGSAAAALGLGVSSVLTFADTRSLLAELGKSRLARVAIDPKRDGPPPADAQRSLDNLRQNYIALQRAYSSTSLLGPGRQVVKAAMHDYASGIKDAFLEPCSHRVEQLLTKYVAGDNGLDFSANSQLVTVYGAMRGEFIAYEKALSSALERQNLWRWSPAELSTAKKTESTSPEASHLDAFLEAREFDGDSRTVFEVPTDVSLLENARQKLSSGDQTQSVIGQILKTDSTARGATEEDLGTLVIQQLEQKSGTKVERTPALEQEISAQRRTQVLSSTANIRLRDTTTLTNVRDGLADLGRPDSETLSTFKHNIEALRVAGAAPRPGLGKDAVTDTYADALADIAKLSTSLETLVRNGNPGHYVLPDVLANKPDTMATFGKDWNAAQDNIARKVDRIAELMKPAGEPISAPAIGAISASLSGILKSVVEAIAREARKEMLQHWTDKLGTDLSLYAERFPSRSDATEEVGVSQFVELFRPDGRIDQELKILDQLCSIKELQPFLGLDRPFVDMRARAKAIQSACFDKDAPARLQFHIAKMNISDPVLNLVLTISQGDAVSKQSGSAEKIQNVVRSWPIGKVGAQLLMETSVELPNNQRLKLSVPKDGNSSSPWGLLRLLQPRAAATEADTKVTLEALGADAKVTWAVPFQTNAGTTVIARAWILFAPEGVQNPLMPRFFVLEPAARIFQARDQ